MRGKLPARLRKYLPARLKKRILRWVLRSLGTVDDYRYVFIITYGRSGSTLLMGVLNTIPGYKIHGENYNALYRLYQADAAVTEGYRMCSGKSKHHSPQSAWYGMPRARPDMFRQQLVNNFVTHVLRPEPGDRVLGFKEIRHTKALVPDLSNYLAFLQRAFPHCKIIFNHRDPAAVAKSSWWALDDQAAEKLQAADERLRAVPADERHFHFFYDRIADGLGHIRELFAFLDEELDEAAVREVLATRHSPPPEKYEKRLAAVRQRS